MLLTVKCCVGLTLLLNVTSTETVMKGKHSTHVAKCIERWFSKCLLYTNICTNKQRKFILKLLRHVSVLIHHLQGVYKLC
jgi:hypothetical protein